MVGKMAAHWDKLLLPRASQLSNFFQSYNLSKMHSLSKKESTQISKTAQGNIHSNGDNHNVKATYDKIQLNLSALPNSQSDMHWLPHKKNIKSSQIWLVCYICAQKSNWAGLLHMCTNQSGFSILNFTLGISNVKVRVFTYLSCHIGKYALWNTLLI